ncbi:hypothetical protein GOBAR_AA24332 [Gossypium barbadense]|uniref:Uncharacterized protein n=1 Tax=Gossypium barbadense TaxID=3634 RepID=A0A2P5WZ11_GOSBA|nr:hypothetical protein GOBAR_AA24332 [Gossypium barbadense]
MHTALVAGWASSMDLYELTVFDPFNSFLDLMWRQGVACFGFGTFHVTGLYGLGIWVSDPYRLTGKLLLLPELCDIRLKTSSDKLYGIDWAHPTAKSCQGETHPLSSMEYPGRDYKERMHGKSNVMESFNIVHLDVVSCRPDPGSHLEVRPPRAQG